MSQLAVDKDTSELIRVNGEFTRVDGAEEIVQHVRCRFRLMQGEVFLIKEAGVDYQAIFTKGVALSVVGGIFRRAAADTPGVENVLTMDPTQTDEERAMRLINFTWKGTYNLELLGEEGPLHDEFIVRVEG